MQAVLINPVGQVFDAKADDSGKVISLTETTKYYRECPKCKHKNKPYNNYCTMCGRKFGKLEALKHEENS
jgi:uncharacterized OB-fold protein